MSDETLNITPVIPGMQTQEGVERVQHELDKRHAIDFRAFQCLRRLSDEGLLCENALYRSLKGRGESNGLAREVARTFAEEVDQILRDRTLSDHHVLQAMAGRPDEREEG